MNFFLLLLAVFFLSGLSFVHLDHAVLVRLDDCGFSTCHSYQEGASDTLQSLSLPEGPQLVQTRFPVLRELSPLNMTILEVALE